jgi:hypothetical protein
MDPRFAIQASRMRVRRRICAGSSRSIAEGWDPFYRATGREFERHDAIIVIFSI